jgi:hypothetical protein
MESSSILKDRDLRGLSHAIQTKPTKEQDPNMVTLTINIEDYEELKTAMLVTLK